MVQYSQQVHDECFPSSMIMLLSIPNSSKIMAMAIASGHASEPWVMKEPRVPTGSQRVHRVVL